MAFVRKKGKSFYLVHNVRENGRVRQVHLACLGNRPRVSDEIVRNVEQAHPNLQIDWTTVRNRAGEAFHSPYHDPEGADQLARHLHGVLLDLRELDPAQMERVAPPEAVAAALEKLHALRDIIDQKLAAWPGKGPQAQDMQSREMPRRHASG